jgi:hypothetical protein
MTHMPRHLVIALLMDCLAGVLQRRQAPSFSGWLLVSFSLLCGPSLLKMLEPVFWAGSLTLAFLEWRKNRGLRPRDPPFDHPEEGDQESAYEVPSIKQDDDDHTISPFSDAYRYSGVSSTAIGSSAAGYTSPKYNIPSAPQPRPSLDAYGAFSDPAPSGFGAPPGDSGVTGVSRTMQYADPYAAVRASVATGPTSSDSSPPSYE